MLLHRFLQPTCNMTNTVMKDLACRSDAKIMLGLKNATTAVMKFRTCGWDVDIMLDFYEHHTHCHRMLHMLAACWHNARIAQQGRFCHGAAKMLRWNTVIDAALKRL